MAKEAGYAEPDPRIDLSGKDVSVSWLSWPVRPVIRWSKPT